MAKLSGVMTDLFLPIKAALSLVGAPLIYLLWALAVVVSSPLYYALLALISVVGLDRYKVWAGSHKDGAMRIAAFIRFYEP